MRILFISNLYPPYDIGGYEQLCAEVATRLTMRGHEIEILTSNYGAPSSLQNISSRISRVLFLQTDISYYRPLDFFFRRPAQEKRNIEMLRQKIDQSHPDLIMVWGMWNLSQQLLYWAERWMPHRVAYFVSSYWPMDLDAHIAYWDLPARHRPMEIVKHPLRTIALARLQYENHPPKLHLENAVCCSQYVRKTLIDAGKLPASAGVVFCGIEPEPFLIHSKLTEEKEYEKPKSLQLVYFGRLVHDKGVHTAIEALGLLKQQGVSNGIRLTILGSGHPAYEHYLKGLASTLQVDEEIEFVSRIRHDEIPEWLAKFDVYLFTSIWPEPMARSVMEAMAAGLLVIGTDVGGQAEMLFNGINALTYQPGDASSLANQIDKVSKNWSLRVELARAGQKMVLERFTLDRMVDDIEELLFKTSRIACEFGS